MKKILALALAATALTCIAADKTVRFDFQTSEARTLDVYPSTYIHPLVAEVVVDTKTGRIHDTWTLSVEDFTARQNPDNDAATLNNLRAYGLFKSSEKHNCDLIIAATFDIKITDQGTTINLVGYPANFSNWATATNADYYWINLENGKQSINYDPSKEPGKDKK